MIFKMENFDIDTPPPSLEQDGHSNRINESALRILPVITLGQEVIKGMMRVKVADKDILAAQKDRSVRPPIDKRHDPKNTPTHINRTCHK
jgi:hypothetical protein